MSTKNLHVGSKDFFPFPDKQLLSVTCLLYRVTVIECYVGYLRACRYSTQSLQAVHKVYKLYTKLSCKFLVNNLLHCTQRSEVAEAT